MIVIICIMTLDFMSNILGQNSPNSKYECQDELLIYSSTQKSLAF